MSRFFYQAFFIGIILTVILLPIFVNPFARYPYEPSKTVLFGGMVVIMTALAGLACLYSVRDRSPTRIYPGHPFEKPLALVNHSLMLPVLVYGIVYLLSTIFSINPRVSLLGLGDHQGALLVGFVLVFFFIAVTAFKSWLQLDHLVSALIFGSIPVAIFGWIQFFGLDVLHWQYAPRRLIFVHATFASHLYLGAYLAMVIPFTISRIADNRSESRGFLLRYITILVLQLSCLFLSFARSVFIALPVGLMVFFWFQLGRRQLRLYLLVTVILLSTGLLLFLVSNRFGEAIFFRTGFLTQAQDFTTIRSDSMISRINTWQRALELIPARGLLGYGPETFPLINTALAVPATPDNQVIRRYLYDPHNLMLYHLTALGLAGLLSLGWVVIRFYQVTRTTINKTADSHQRLVLAALVSSVTVYLVQAQFNPDSIVLLVLFWLFLAIGYSSSRWTPDSF